MVERSPQVPEASAEGAIKSIYSDIKATLRVPFVDLPFRVLAANPDFLQVAWTQLKPNVQTAYFQHRADDLRRRAVDAASAFEHAGLPEPGDAAAVLSVFQESEPKSLLVAAALRSATTGHQPRLLELTREEKRQVPSGPPDGAAPELLDPEAASPDVSALFSEVQQRLEAPAVPDEFRALGRWPDYLQTAWPAVARVMDTAEYRGAKRELQQTAEEAILGFPYRLDLTPHWLRRSGLSDADIDAVHTALGSMYRVCTHAIVMTAFLLGGAR